MEKRSMEHFAGLDVSVNETSICIVDETGRIVIRLMARPPQRLVRLVLESHDGKGLSAPIPERSTSP
jgi:hypothetical protein